MQKKKKGYCSFVSQHHLHMAFLMGEAAGYRAHSIRLVLVWYHLCLRLRYARTLCNFDAS
ncbi:unnamed protein product [Ixodes pacificus]